MEAKQKLELQAEKFKFEGNQKQFIFNTEIEDLVAKIKEANTAKNYKKIAHLAEQAESLLHKRQKLFCGICVFTLRSFPMIFVFPLWCFVFLILAPCELPTNLDVVVLTVPVGDSENYFYLVERSELKWKWIFFFGSDYRQYIKKKRPKNLIAFTGKGLLPTHFQQLAISWLSPKDKKRNNETAKIVARKYDRALNLSLPGSKITFSQPSKYKCIGEVVRIGIIII